MSTKCLKLGQIVLLLSLLFMLCSCKTGFDAQGSPTPDPTLPTGYTPTGLLYRGSPNANLILYEMFAAWCPHCARHHTELMPALLDQYARNGQVQFVLVDLPWERNQEVHHAGYCVGEQLGAEAHWQFWNGLYRSHDRWWKQQERFVDRLVRNASVDPDVYQRCLDTQAQPWLQGIEVIANQKLGDRYGTPVFRLEDRQGQELQTWVGAFPDLETWQEVLGSYIDDKLKPS